MRKYLGVYICLVLAFVSCSFALKAQSHTDDFTYGELKHVVLKGEKTGLLFSRKRYLSQDDFPLDSGKNTVYVIKNKFILKEDITIPDGSILVFNGGSLKGASVLWHDINVSGSFYGHDALFKNRIIIRKGLTLDSFMLDGFLVIDTEEKVVLRNCNIFSNSSTERDYQILINKANANLELSSCKVYCNNRNVRYGVYTPYQVNTFLVNNCEFYGFSEMAINCANRINNAVIDSNSIHDIGSFELKNGHFSTNAIGVRINKNLDDNKPDYSCYDGMSIVIKNNTIRDLISYYTTNDDAIESHGILVYGNNIIVEGNTVENLMAGTSRDDLSIYCGSEHEGIYVKGDNCTITNNVLRNACGNYGSEGAIAVKWFGLGGKITNNQIYQCFGNGIWSQCRGVNISNNHIHYNTPPDSNGAMIDRFYGIYNYVETKSFIPIHAAAQYVSNINGNKITSSKIDNVNGFLISVDNNIDDINICNNSVSVDGYVQLFRIVEQDSGKGIKRSVIIQGNEIEKPYPIRRGDFVQQDIVLGCGNDAWSVLTLSINDNVLRYNRAGGPNIQAGCVLRNYSSKESIHIVMNNNALSLPQYFSSCFFLLENGVTLLDISNNVFNLQLDNLINSRLTDGKCDVRINRNHFDCKMGILQVGKNSRLNNFYFEDNTSSQSAQIQLISSEGLLDNKLNNLSITGNTIHSFSIVDQNKRIKTRGVSNIVNNTM